MKSPQLASYIVLLTKGHNARLNQLAKRYGLSRSAVIRKLIDDATTKAKKEAANG